MTASPTSLITRTKSPPGSILETGKANSSPSCEFWTLKRAGGRLRKKGRESALIGMNSILPLSHLLSKMSFCLAKTVSDGLFGLVRPTREHPGPGLTPSKNFECGKICENVNIPGSPSRFWTTELRGERSLRQASARASLFLALVSLNLHYHRPPGGKYLHQKSITEY